MSQPASNCIPGPGTEGHKVKLAGKVAFITGLGSGLGQAIAVLFAKEGAAVAGTSTTEAKGRETVAMIEAAGQKALFSPGMLATRHR